MALTALAGPMTNFLLAFLGYVVYAVLWKQGFFFAGRALVRLVYSFLMIFVSVNLGLGVFNLIPIPPLDGSRILGLVLPEKYYFGYMRYERYGLYLLMAIILIENLTNIDILPLNEFKTMIGTWMLKIAAFLVGVPTQM
jgi:Zn-dependent protease